MKAVVDRFEGDYAVLLVEGQPNLDVPRANLPEGIGEGDHIQVQVVDGRVTRVEHDAAATEDAQLRIQDKLDRLRRGEHLDKK